MTPEPVAFRPAWLWTGDELLRAPTVVLEDGRVRFEARGLPVVDLDGIVLPGLVNAHTHLELAATPTPRGQGIVPWVGALRNGPPPSDGTAVAGVAQSWAFGTALVGDVTNTGASRHVLADGPVEGVVFHEVLGIDVLTAPDVDGLSPHAPHSTHPALVNAAAARAARHPDGRFSVHCDEDPDERAFLLDHSGRWPAIMARLGRDLGAFPPTGLTPVAHLDALGALSPHALLVHLTLTRGEDLDTVATRGARVALCPRSNLHITGGLPDAAGLLARGVPVALGTDSLASSPDLDLLAEAASARASFPDVDPVHWLRAITSAGADALGRRDHGRIVEGHPAALLHVSVHGAGGVPPATPPLPGDIVAALFDGTRWRRRWLT